jgi:hypothetical protein
MATFYDHSALEALLDVIRDGVNTNGKVVLIHGYTQGDTYASVMDVASVVAEATINGGVTYFTAGFSGTTHRVLNFLGVDGVATVNGGGEYTGGDLSIALVDDAIVYAVTNETSNQTITDGNSVTFPAFYMQASQPTQAGA